MTPDERYSAITTWRRIKEAQRTKERRLDRYEREMTQTRELTDDDLASMIKRNEVPESQEQ